MIWGRAAVSLASLFVRCFLTWDGERKRFAGSYAHATFISTCNILLLKWFHWTRILLIFCSCFLDFVQTIANVAWHSSQFASFLPFISEYHCILKDLRFSWCCEINQVLGFQARIKTIKNQGIHLPQGNTSKTNMGQTTQKSQQCWSSTSQRRQRALFKPERIKETWSDCIIL